MCGWGGSECLAVVFALFHWSGRGFCGAAGEFFRIMAFCFGFSGIDKLNSAGDRRGRLAHRARFVAVHLQSGLACENVARQCLQISVAKGFERRFSILTARRFRLDSGPDGPKTKTTKIAGLAHRGHVNARISES